MINIKVIKDWAIKHKKEIAIISGIAGAGALAVVIFTNKHFHLIPKKYSVIFWKDTPLYDVTLEQVMQIKEFPDKCAIVKRAGRNAFSLLKF